MHVATAFERRETLSDSDLERLAKALLGEVDAYKVAIAGYSAEKMQRYGRPYLAELEERVAAVDRLRLARES